MDYPYIHRDISWLDFNYRVLQEAKDPLVPLFEKIKFLAIYSSNLGEFFQVRIANHRNIMRAGKKAKKTLGYLPEETIRELLDKINDQLLDFSNIFESEIIPDLRNEGIHILKRTELNSEQIDYINVFFEENLLPYVQPVLLVKDKIKPFLNNGSLYLALHLQDEQKQPPETQYAIVKIPSDHIDRFIPLPAHNKGEHDIILLDDIVRHSVEDIFPGYSIIDSFSIKLTRDAELYIDDEYSGDLIEKIKKSLIKRDVGIASRLVYDREMPIHLLSYLAESFDLTKYDLLPEGRYHNNFDFFQFPTFNKHELENIPLDPIPYATLEDASDIFKVISQQDHLLHFPYQSYDSVVQFFEQAAKDPAVTDIKIIQYRVGSKSRIMNALAKAVKNGKTVNSFVEVKARFDEEANLKWGKILEDAGVKVHYSIPGLKVHAKLALVVRTENKNPKIYAYLGTGNFHEGTAKIYSDIGLFTSNPELTEECLRLMGYLENKQLPSLPFQNLAVGKFNLNSTLINLVKAETQAAKNGQPAEIILKMNSLQERDMIDLLYEASQAGVKVKLIVRGICSLVANVPGISDNIEVISIVDRFLEHARIFMFHNGGDTKIFLSSADWMYRNLHHRIELIFPILDPALKKEIIEVVELQLLDNIKARNVGQGITNTYRRNKKEVAIQSQIETYYYIKRIKTKA